MRRNPSGDWDLPGGAFVFLIVVTALSFAANAFGGVTYVDPAGWSMEIVAQVHYSSFAKFEGIAQLMPKTECKLIREMSEHQADYIECRVDIPTDETLWIGPFDTFVAVLEDSARVDAVRVVATEGMDQRRLFDSSDHEFQIGGTTKIARARSDGRRVLFLHFPPNTVRPERIACLEFHSREEVIEQCVGRLW